MDVQFNESNFLETLRTQREAEQLAKQSAALTRAREISGALYEEALSLALDHGTRSEGAIAAILATLTEIYLVEVSKNV